MAHATEKYMPQIEDLLGRGVTRYAISQSLRGKVSRATVYRMANQLLKERGLAA